MTLVATSDEVRRTAATNISEAGAAPRSIIVTYGFWIFLLSDIVMFAALFAAYAVLAGATAGGPTGAQLFERSNVAIETVCLLASSYTCGLMSLAIRSQNRAGFYLWALATFALGAAFLGLEVREFTELAAQGAIPQRSGFLSAFFTLVGCHGLHVAAGLVWLTVMMVQVGVENVSPRVGRRLACFALFWHALDIVWIWLFSVVYLIGVSP